MPGGMLVPAVAGVVAGTLAGMALAVLWPELASRRGYGIVILVAVALSLAAPPLRPNAPTLAGAALVSGVMGGFAGVHGPLMGLAVAGLNAQAVRGVSGYESQRHPTFTIYNPTRNLLLRHTKQETRNVRAPGVAASGL